MSGGKEATKPIDVGQTVNAPRLVIQPAYKDTATGALYVHEDLETAIAPWETEKHIPPIGGVETFGDVESWAEYVNQYAPLSTPMQGPLLTWNEQRLCAVLDYHGKDGTPNRCQWVAKHTFERSRQWQTWTGLADGRARTQRELIEAFDDHQPDIVEPIATDLVALLRTLRASSNSQAETELRADGTSRAVFSKDNKIVGEVSVPSEIAILIPVLKGHFTTNADGKRDPVLYRLTVKLRVTVDDSARLTFRLSIPRAEQTLEAAVEDRVEAAKRLLGDDFTLLRAW